MGGVWLTLCGFLSVHPCSHSGSGSVFLFCSDTFNQISGTLAKCVLGFGWGYEDPDLGIQGLR